VDLTLSKLVHLSQLVDFSLFAKSGPVGISSLVKYRPYDSSNAALYGQLQPHLPDCCEPVFAAQTSNSIV